MNRKYLLILIILPFLISACSLSKAETKTSLPGKFVFWSLREGSSARDWAVYTLVDGKIKKISTKIGYPVWSSDGQLIVAETDRGRLIKIFDLNGNLVKDIAIKHRPFSYAVFGNKIFYVGVEESSGYVAQTYISAIDINNNNELEIFKLAPHEEVFGIYISHDGKKIMYSTGTSVGDKTVEPYLYAASIDGQNIKRLLPQATPVGWYPDNVHVAVQTNVSPDSKRMNYLNGVLAKVNIETGEFQILRPMPVLSSDTRLSKDGKYIYYPRSGSHGGAGISVLPIDSDKEIQVTTPSYVNDIIKYSQDLQPNWYQGE